MQICLFERIKIIPGQSDANVATERVPLSVAEVSAAGNIFLIDAHYSGLRVRKHLRVCSNDDSSQWRLQIILHFGNWWPTPVFAK